MPDYSKTTPKDVFLYLLMIVTLTLSVVGVLMLLFQYVNYLFPEDGWYSFRNISDIVRTGTAMTIVSWPIFLVVSGLIYKDQRAHAQRRDIRVRRWLIYLTLFVAAITLIIDLIALLNTFLGGELTVRFILKVVSILAVAGAVFGYYLWDVRQDTIASSSLPKWMGIGVSLGVFGVIVGSFFVMGTPAHQRAVRLDEQRVSDLVSIQSQVFEYYREKNTLPETLEALENDITGFVLPTDPETDAVYGYAPTGELAFDLCASFATATDEKRANERYPIYSENWNHPVGEYCYGRVVDPDLLDGGVKPVPVR